MQTRTQYLGAVWIFVLGTTAFTSAQVCPPDDGSLRPGQSTTLTGTIRYHNELREWIGLQLYSPVCGQKVLQPTFITGKASEEEEWLHYR